MKVVLRLLLVIAAVLSRPLWCNAQDSDGNNLLADCAAAITVAEKQPLDVGKLFDAGRCIGLMQGILNMNDVYGLKGETMFFCRPGNISSTQAARIVVKYLRDHPEQLHEHEFILAMAALRSAFPCPDKK